MTDAVTEVQPRVLFVDDEVGVLKSLQRGLRIHCRDLEVRFCQSPEQALTIIKEFQPWIVVSDKRMPEMDGGEFLRRVSVAFPEVIRVMLTGDTCKDVALEVADVAHMLIAKPFKIETLLQSIHRATCLRSLPVSLEIRKQLGAIDCIPVLPKVYQELVDAIKSEEADTQQIAEIISKDPGILAKIIQMANSSFFGFSSAVSNSHDATVRLGLELIKDMVLCFAVFKQCNSSNAEASDQLLAEAMVVADITRQLSIVCGCNRQQVNNAFVIGLMHNVGALISSMSVVQLEEGAEDDLPREEDVVSAYMLALWELDTELVDAVFYQSVPQQYPGSSVLCYLLHTAKVIHHFRIGGLGAPMEEDLQDIQLQPDEVKAGVMQWLKDS